MLVYQGAIAFQMWTGVEAPINVMRRALEEVFGT
jgi:shikimate dehydrogenase